MGKKSSLKVVKRMAAAKAGVPVVSRPSAVWRIFLFIEHPITLTVGGLVGGLMGILISTPVFLVCSVCLLLGLHRSGAVAGCKNRTQIALYLALFVTSFSLFWWAGGLIRAKGQKNNIDMANAIVKEIGRDQGGTTTGNATAKENKGGNQSVVIDVTGGNNRVEDISIGPGFDIGVDVKGDGNHFKDVTVKGAGKGVNVTGKGNEFEGLNVSGKSKDK